jgi:sugar phosphate isomerase/epimerase
VKLGVSGLLEDGGPAAVRRVRDLGFGTASWHLPNWEALGPANLAAVADTLAGEGVELAQLLPPQHPSLVDPDPAARAAGVAALTRVLEAAAELGAANVYVRPGSLNPAGPWTPHPENRRAETRLRLVEALRELAPRAAALGVPLALEGHTVSPVYSVAVAAEVLAAVDSPWVGFNADPVNLVGNLDEAYDTTSLIEALFDRLGPRVLTAHAKDLIVEDRLVLHLEECVPGLGLLDQEAFLRCFAACRPEGVVLIEHLAAERVPEARRALLELAERAGVPFQGP